MLEFDYKSFHDYLDGIQEEEDKMNDQLEKSKRMKKTIELEYNLLMGKITSLKGENHKLEEIVGIYRENQEFLEKIAPKEWQDRKKNEYNKLYSTLLANYIEKNTIKKEANDSRTFMKLSQTDKNTVEKSRIKLASMDSEINKITQLKEDYSREFNELVENNKIPELEDFNDQYEMPFKDHKFLDNYFDAQEEKSLVQIQLIEEIEHNYFEHLKIHRETKEILEKRYQKLMNDKTELSEQYKEKSKDIIRIQKIQQRNEFFENDESLSKEISRITSKILKEIESESNEEIEVSNNEYDILCFLEKYMSDLERQIKSIPKDLYIKHFNKIQKKRKAKEREEREKMAAEQYIEKMKRNYQKMMEPSKKRKGRPIMEKRIIESVKKKVDIKRENSEELDWKRILFDEKSN